MKTKCVFIIFLLILPISVGGQTLTVPQKVDEFGIINCEDWMVRSENLSSKMREDATSLGYIVYYGGQVNIKPYGSWYTKRLPRRGEAFARAAAIKSRFVENFGIDENRIILLNGGYRESWAVELWLVPKGARPPLPVPTLTESEIKFRKGRMRKLEYTCWEL
jgi:hypothetical protein